MRYGKVAVHYKAPKELLHHVDVGIKEKSTNLIKGTTLGGNRDVSRSSDIAWIGDKDLREMFLGFAHRANYDAQWLFQLTECEHLQYILYQNEGDQYSWHHDQRPPSVSEGGYMSVRKVSMTMFLSDPDEYEGGELDILTHPFKEEPHVTFKMPKGTVLFFKSHYFHRVRPVTSGVRKSLVAWFSGSPYV